MTINDIIERINEIKHKDAWDFYVWLNWFVRKHSCVDCVETHITLNKRPNCLKCIPSTSLINKRFKNIKDDNVDEGCSVKHTIVNKISRKKEIKNETKQKED